MVIDGDSSPFCPFVHGPKLSAVSLSNKTFKWLWVNVIRLKDLRQIEWTKTLVIVLPFAPIVPILRSESLQNISHTVWPSFTLTGAVLLSPFTFTGFITADKGQPTKQLVMSAGFWVPRGRPVCSTLEREKRLGTPVMASGAGWPYVVVDAACRLSWRTLYVLDISRGIHENDRLISWAVGLFFTFHDRFLDPDRCAPFRIQNSNSIPDTMQKYSFNSNVKNNWKTFK